MRFYRSFPIWTFSAQKIEHAVDLQNVNYVVNLLLIFTMDFILSKEAGVLHMQIMHCICCGFVMKFMVVLT